MENGGTPAEVQLALCSVPIFPAAFPVRRLTTCSRDPRIAVHLRRSCHDPSPLTFSAQKVTGITGNKTPRLDKAATGGSFPTVSPAARSHTLPRIISSLLFGAHTKRTRESPASLQSDRTRQQQHKLPPHTSSFTLALDRCRCHCLPTSMLAVLRCNAIRSPWIVPYKLPAASARQSCCVLSRPNTTLQESLVSSPSRDVEYLCPQKHVRPACALSRPLSDHVRRSETPSGIKEFDETFSGSDSCGHGCCPSTSA